jgi:putative ABC transport system substrate-binding protein
MRRRELMFLLGGVLTAVRAPSAQKAMPVIGLLGLGSADTSASFIAAFHQGLKETGYVEGQNVAVEYRWAEGRYDRLPALAADLVSQRVGAIVTSSTTGIQAAKNATPTIPIVFTGGGDPVAEGFVASLARPGGNLTGITFRTVGLMPKRLELLSELVPQAKMIALLVNLNNAANAEQMIREVHETTSAKGLQLQILKAGTESEIDAAFATLVQLHADALVVGADPFFYSQREQLAALAARHTVPTIYEWREFVAAGGLVSYGTSLAGAWRQVGMYVGKILNGAKPIDLPVQRPTKFELFVNLKTAKSLGLTVPLSILASADGVIE